MEKLDRSGAFTEMLNKWCEIRDEINFNLEDIQSNKETELRELSKEDIESFGFIDQNSRGMAENNGFLFKKTAEKPPLLGYTMQFWNINNFGNGKRVRIEGHLGCCFDGKLKNKLDLSNLLQQLEII